MNHAIAQKPMVAPWVGLKRIGANACIAATKGSRYLTLDPEVGET